jgi:hypothetical protein
MAFVDELTDWTERDAAAAALGRTLGIFTAESTTADVTAVLWTNGAAGHALYGILERLAWLGVLERDEEGERFRAAHATLHPLGERDDVPSLVAGPPPRAQIDLTPEPPGGLCLAADRAGYRYLARVFDEIASSPLAPRGGRARFSLPSSTTARKAPDAALSLALIDPEVEPEAEAS